MRVYQVEAIKIAKDLRYGDKVIQKIKEAKTEWEVQQILTSARKEKL